jgi:alpha-N-arabinofuranosidase
MRKVLFIFIIGLLTTNVTAQNKIVLNADSAKTKISKHIYGHFAEHLGRCIYDGFYVGDENKTIPNTNGVRNDIIQALKELQIPNLRWPGGCFADTYHWKDAIGPKSERKPIENTSWGGYREDNSFGTNEFLDLCEILGAEPYLAVNMNTGTVRDAVDWVQYANHPNGTSYFTDLREQNGRDRPWHVKYWGIGNESWDCGGDMMPEYYVNLYRRYATAMTTYNNAEQLFRIAVGPGNPDQYHWIDVIMQNVPARRIEGISIHHYSVIDWSKKGSSHDFSEEEYVQTMQKAFFMEEYISKNSALMDKYDPDKRVALIVDEWGGWYDTDPGKSILYQQNTIRDAMIAGLTLNIFNNHADRVRMANLAQTVNVLQAVVLTEGEKMLLTPTYHVMNMYKIHQEGTLIPSKILDKAYFQGMPAISASASMAGDNKMHISLTNIDHLNDQNVEIAINGFRAQSVTGSVLTSAKVQDHNTFDQPDNVVPTAFNGAKIDGKNLELTMPPNSVIMLELTR